MHLERGLEILSERIFKTTLLSLWGSSSEINGTWFIFIWSSIFYWNCTFVLLDGVEWTKSRSILLKHISRMYYKWWFYLIILFTYVSRNNFSSSCLCMKVWILVAIIALLYDDDLYTKLNTWIISYVIYLS